VSYGPAAGAAAVLDVGGRLPRTGRAATAVAAALGPAVASYTAVLAADTAVPGWHEGYRELPFLFVGSAAAAAGGMALIAAPRCSVRRWRPRPRGRWSGGSGSSPRPTARERRGG